MSDGVFDEDVARSYDADIEHMYAPEVLIPTVDVLSKLSSGGSALEFAIGTGRVAVPLARRGVHVEGIELSAAMADVLREREGGETINVVIGDMATTTVPGAFDLVYLVFNTIGNLTSQDQQTACFVNAARHLKRGGRFVIEVGVPALRRLPPGERFVTFSMSHHYIGVDEYDLVTQSLVSHHLNVDDEGRARSFRTPQRYVWPAELDLMAQISGMRLESRWESWDKTAFTHESEHHVSVWIKP
ncbi:class I SAM-dependent DNA methyltransferase [Agromyces silvae]|uniref:class I SAM-dependent DNA methyltransferase n=1 Tax=Agromyces silvae TaxID=3388266 RepID=UPI00280B34A3|nr:class I SAM-dependent methyltransferase [Agromyces protaetiae]